MTQKSGSALSVGDLMTPDPIVIGDEPLADAARLFDQHRIHGLPVVDADGSLIGVISQTDMIRARTTEQLWAGWRGLRVRHLMTSPPDHWRGCQPVRCRGRAGGQRRASAGGAGGGRAFTGRDPEQQRHRARDAREGGPDAEEVGR